MGWFPTHDRLYPPGSFRRAREGHKTVWEATVSPREDGYWGEVERYEGRVARLHPPTGRWWMGPLPTPEAAMSLVDRFLALWRDPATWRETPPRVPIGNCYTLRVLDAERALAWPEGSGGVVLDALAGSERQDLIRDWGARFEGRSPTCHPGPGQRRRRPQAGPRPPL